jgi:hypothetical protein
MNEMLLNLYIHATSKDDIKKDAIEKDEEQFF